MFQLVSSSHHQETGNISDEVHVHVTGVLSPFSFVCEGFGGMARSGPLPGKISWIHTYILPSKS